MLQQQHMQAGPHGYSKAHEGSFKVDIGPYKRHIWPWRPMGLISGTTNILRTRATYVRQVRETISGVLPSYQLLSALPLQVCYGSARSSAVVASWHVRHRQTPYMGIMHVYTYVYMYLCIYIYICVHICAHRVTCDPFLKRDWALCKGSDHSSYEG